MTTALLFGKNKHKHVVEFFRQRKITWFTDFAQFLCDSNNVEYDWVATVIVALHCHLAAIFRNPNYWKYSMFKYSKVHVPFFRCILFMLYSFRYISSSTYFCSWLHPPKVYVHFLTFKRDHAINHVGSVVTGQQ